ncbi:MAG: nuclear transport factor 2 family protein [Candidatus Methylacidiphilales bacterium]|nr:nuclear transport factor 2 family protein [Candidatus Methylacidiphilales bacterium]
MNRRDAILAGISTFAAAIAVAPAAIAADETDKDFGTLVPLLKAHDDAFTKHDLPAVLATFASKSVVMGTGPGELWSGKEELTTAYENFFKGFDKGQQDYEYRHRVGMVTGDSAWLVTSGDSKMKKDGKEVAFPLNISFAFVKEGGAWKISLLHFSTFTSEKG